MKLTQVLLVIALAAVTEFANGCSNIIVSPGASADGSSIVAYNADSSTVYGLLYHYPAADHAAGAMRDVWDWDSGRYLGQIKEASHTYNVVGNTNEHGLIIGETTYGGIGVLQTQSGAKIDYGSLIWITLQRSTNAREAIQTIGDLMAEYGYASEGESFSIADQKEAWIMEIIGKGEYELGAVWVARKVPDGYVTAHANQARIQTFPLNDPENCIYAKDTITFARKIGLYPETAKDEDFSFSDVYDPVTFSGARFCDARVWSVFRDLLGDDWSKQYLDYAQGYNLTNRMPLWIQPSSKVSVQDTMEYMRSHYEDTPLDMSGIQFNDVGAAYSKTPYRTHPLTWSSNVNPDGTAANTPVSYLHERPIATPQTGWNFVAQSRGWMPRELASLFWFGVDDSSTTVHFPIYGSATRVPEYYGGKGPQDGVVPPMMTFSMQSAFYVFNLVANWAYTRWDLIYPDVYSEIIRREAQFIEEIKNVDTTALNLIQTKDIQAAIEYVTAYSATEGNKLVTDWGNFFGQLFVKYRDGYVITSNAGSTNCGCSSASQGYPQAWFDRIVTDTGDHYLVHEDSSASSSTKVKDSKLAPISKKALLSRR